MMLWLAAVLALIVVLLFAIVDMGLFKSKYFLHSLKGKNVVVTGGSRGIGLAIAQQAAAEGAKVVIIARNKARIDEAVEEIKSAAKATNPDAAVYGVSCDLSNAEASYSAFTESEKLLGGPVDLLICNAGTSKPGYFEQLAPETFVEQMQMNYLSAVYIAQAAFRSMMNTKRGHICLVSSVLGQCGMFGFGAYSPTKFAVKGLAEVLAWEGRPHNIGISILYPPDTDTPGFEEENKTKPPESAALSEEGGFFTSEQVAKKCLSDIKKGTYAITMGTNGILLGYLTSGYQTQVTVVQVLTMSILRLVTPLFHADHNKIIMKFYKERTEAKKSQ